MSPAVMVLVWIVGSNTAIAAPPASPLRKMMTLEALRTDTILLTNGEIVEGEIVQLSKGLLEVRVPTTGGSPTLQTIHTVKVPLQEIESFAIGALPSQETEKTATRETAEEAVEQGPQGVGWPASRQPELLELDLAHEIAADRVNPATRPLTPGERGAIRYYNEYLEAKRQALDTRAEAFQARTDALQANLSMSERNHLMSKATHLEDKANELDRRAAALYEAYRSARPRLAE